MVEGNTFQVAAKESEPVFLHVYSNFDDPEGPFRVLTAHLPQGSVGAQQLSMRMEPGSIEIKNPQDDAKVTAEIDEQPGLTTPPGQRAPLRTLRVPLLPGKSRRVVGLPAGKYQVRVVGSGSRLLDSRIVDIF